MKEKMRKGKYHGKKIHVVFRVFWEKGGSLKCKRRNTLRRKTTLHLTSPTLRDFVTAVV